MGLFGSISVVDSPRARQLCINGQVQGGSFHHPSAAIVDPDLCGPGPVPSSVYTLGWLAAGAHRPTAKALMLGLGSGAGAVGFLYDFPAASLDVIEIDPELIAAATKGFPLLQHYIDLGRLRIMQGDVAEIVPDIKPKAYDAAFHDVYTGDPCLGVSGVGFYEALADVANGEIWLNIIGWPDQPPMALELVALTEAGVPPRFMMPADHALLSPFWGMSCRMSNWIVSTGETNPEILDAFEPYSALNTIEHPSDEAVAAVGFVRTSWEEALRRSHDAEDLQGLMGALVA